MSLNKKSVDDINVKGKRVLMQMRLQCTIKERRDHRREHDLLQLFLLSRSLSLTVERLSFVHTLERLRQRRTSRLRLLHLLLRDLQSSSDRKLSSYQCLEVVDDTV